MLDQDQLDRIIGQAAWEAGKKAGRDIAKALGKELKFFETHIEGESRGWLIEQFCSGVYYQLEEKKDKIK